jgi:hypothetical protein
MAFTPSGWRRDQLSAFIIKALSASMTNKNNIGDRGERSNLDRKKWRYGEGTVGGARERSMHSVGREVTEREERWGWWWWWSVELFLSCIFI